ncbi:MAG: cell division protein FtsL [Piscirickettsiaceae bacterium CG_4_9_14_3_um_filter_43_564]|nr:MAG: cell division protein FtsL [Piscirickettsiaceae bacterium CG18_big_fil_WC_8_21_14_2_50_44_103]PIU38419.1 MAG: cell division protein FtsL [Piscirickettsiaceae bacterium CG07_land_8_20_14_0_80_44_28]PIW56981.1 MAG: cell division protein FtsL [Piscirickettsiaceae bacterium CG12_big_fil_rev_8_21_14_0_65_44_934]PIW78612.1 MAG: cell division protein FtsL [Piscirickettsiaceae bacterium CG_4_8_14_3_um_filter_44_38]PIX78627.1 MAG: cell division protein FtsL [Piscirickettsiaceae bacterium CG_4_10
MAVQKLPSLRPFKTIHWQGFFALFLLSVLVISMIAIVEVQHQVRHLETQVAQSLKKQVTLHQELGRLTLEKHHLTALARVEYLAKTQLNMTLEKSPKRQNFQIIFLEKNNATDEPESTH